MRHDREKCARRYQAQVIYRDRWTKRGFRLVNERRHDRGGWLYVANEIDAFTREDY